MEEPMKLLLALLLAIPLNAQPLVDRIQPFEDATKNPAIVGDKGKSRGMWQMGELAWKDVNKLRKRHGLPLYQWKTGAHDPFVARQYAEAYLSILRNRLTRALRRPLSDADMLAAWSMGFNGYSRAGFSLNNCPVWLQRKAKAL